ncbi:MAG: sulfite exporter TauE/SafE family protein [Pseudomonadota bacterium]
MLSDPSFYIVSVPAVLLYGIAKGGFGGAIAILAVPLMSFVMPPTRAAAILLPILVLMDFVVVYSYRSDFDKTALKLLLPGGLIGVAAGWIFADAMNEALTRVFVGSVAIVFGLQFLFALRSTQSSVHSAGFATLFGTMAGFTSFSIHAGGPPFAMYLMPKRLPPVVYAGTAGIFFLVVNLAKLPAYYALDLFARENLVLALVLMPIAPLGVLFGRFLVRRSPAGVYYRVISIFLVLVGAKLLYDGVIGLP